MIEVENTDVNICSQKSHTNEKSHASERLWSESHFRLVLNWKNPLLWKILYVMLYYHDFLRKFQISSNEQMCDKHFFNGNGAMQIYIRWLTSVTIKRFRICHVPRKEMSKEFWFAIRVTVTTNLIFGPDG